MVLVTAVTTAAITASALKNIEDLLSEREAASMAECPFRGSNAVVTGVGCSERFGVQTEGRGPDGQTCGIRDNKGHLNDIGLAGFVKFHIADMHRIVSLEVSLLMFIFVALPEVRCDAADRGIQAVIIHQDDFNDLSA